MTNAAGVARSWLEWGSAVNLPSPHYVTISMSGSGARISFAVDRAYDVAQWARKIGVPRQSTAHHGKLYHEATYVVPDYQIDVYSVTTVTPGQFARMTGAQL
jgi:hypothetical protein